MKKILPILLVILMLPLVSAAELSFYPDEKAFEEFLNDERGYYVVSGESEYSQAWATYLDAKLSRFKERGQEVIVLVGNVYENPKMKELWELTGLPYEASLNPSVIVLDNAVFFTGNEENIYLIEEPFSQKYAFEIKEIYGALLIVSLLVFLFTFLFSKHGKYTHFFYILVVALLALWFSNSSLFTISEVFLKSIFQNALIGQEKGSLLTLFFSLYFRVYSPTEEAVLILHLSLILLIATLLFFIAPKPYRELGFVVFGLTFASPTFRHSLETFNGSIFEILFLVTVLAIVVNTKFIEEDSKLIKQIMILSVITGCGVLIWPYLLLIPVFMFLALPTKSMKNYLYLGLTAAIFLAGRSYFNVPLPEWPLVVRFDYLMLFMKEGIVQLILISYVLFRFRRSILRMKGGKALLLWLFLSYLVLVLAIPEVMLALILVSSGLAVRLITELYLT